MTSFHRAIIFDLVGTLIYPQPSAAEVYCEVGREHGSRWELREVQRRFISAMKTARWNDGGDVEHKVVWQQIVATVFELTFDQAAPLFAELWEHFAQPTAWAVFPDVATNWPRLMNHYEFLAIGSNFDSRIEPILRGLDLWVEDAVFWSSKLNASKPDPRFFRSIEGSLQLDPAQCLMVGDDLHHDYYGAQEAGWSALLIDRQGIVQPGINKLGSLDEL